MAVPKSALRRCRRSPWRRPVRLDLEALETRTLPAAFPAALLVADVEPNDTLDVAQSLGDITIAGHVAITGTIGGKLSGADVDWFQFTLDDAALVTVTATGNN